MKVCICLAWYSSDNYRQYLHFSLELDPHSVSQYFKVGKSEQSLNVYFLKLFSTSSFSNKVSSSILRNKMNSVVRQYLKMSKKFATCSENETPRELEALNVQTFLKNQFKDPSCARLTAVLLSIRKLRARVVRSVQLRAEINLSKFFCFHYKHRGRYLESTCNCVSHYQLIVFPLRKFL